MSDATESLDELKAMIAAHREEGQRLIRHINRIEKEYSDWEDRTILIENAVAEAEIITGLSKEEILAPIEIDIFEEAFGGN